MVQRHQGLGRDVAEGLHGIIRATAHHHAGVRGRGGAGVSGQTIKTLAGFGLPANVATYQDLMVVPELYARVTILDTNDRVVAQLGDDSQRIRADRKFAIRADASQWRPGRFVHPHDACFDQEGNLFVAEWVATGRVTKLKRLG